jgi:Bacterial Ig-like domain (group 3)
VTGTGEEKPTGAVKLLKGTDLLGEATLSMGEARLTGIKLAAGTSELTARYGGDSTHEASTSAAFKQVVSDTGCSADAGAVKPGIDSAASAR